MVATADIELGEGLRGNGGAEEPCQRRWSHEWSQWLTRTSASICKRAMGPKKPESSGGCQPQTNRTLYILVSI